MHTATKRAPSPLMHGQLDVAPLPRASLLGRLRGQKPSPSRLPLDRLKPTVDALIVTEVYAAGEAPIPGADGRAICRTVRTRGRVEPLFVEKVEELASSLKEVIRAGDLIVTMGAGHINAVSHGLPDKLSTRRGSR